MVRRSAILALPPSAASGGAIAVGERRDTDSSGNPTLAQEPITSPAVATREGGRNEPPPPRNPGMRILGAARPARR